ncbi:hypothetical protein Nepgr_033243 [Nepenthes gracilis]|uniref:Uncharacterized protein n=1 Tax=Nepenthes gracilis TaxID=150966 RepID=A0AAD3TK55_NEPGR|nr:hypothetical protein Nepgr_033243 [Nepenthes gracilis]
MSDVLGLLGHSVPSELTYLVILVSCVEAPRLFSFIKRSSGLFPSPRVRGVRVLGCFSDFLGDVSPLWRPRAPIG